MRFFNWEARPAVMAAGWSAAWAVLAPGEGWTAVEPVEVSESGAALASEAQLRAAFATTFGELPPLPQ